MLLLPHDFQKYHCQLKYKKQMNESQVFYTSTWNVILCIHSLFRQTLSLAHFPRQITTLEKPDGQN